MTKTSQWFLLNRAHALLASKHAEDRLLGLGDEWYIGTLLRTYGLQNETTCDWQGPTFANWTEGAGHPETYHDMSRDLLRRMRLSSMHAAVECKWQDALSQAADPARFFNTSNWEWRGHAPAFQPMHSTCPLFARKLAPEAQSSFMDALWPAGTPWTG